MNMSTKKGEWKQRGRMEDDAIRASHSHPESPVVRRPSHRQVRASASRDSQFAVRESPDAGLKRISDFMVLGYRDSRTL
jgi:hypothetical protein